jgi:transposase
MKKNLLFVGLDVHKDTIVIALAEEGEEPRVYGTIPNDLRTLQSVIGKLKRPKKALRFVYEAGPCGFNLYRYLRSKGYDCIVISPAHMPRAAASRRKTDKRDALQLVRLHRSGDLTGIFVPTAEDEAIRDLVRARKDVLDDRKRNRYRLKSLMLRNGLVYPGRGSWGAAHMRHLRELKMTHAAQQIAFEEYLQAIENDTQRLERINAQIAGFVAQWRFLPVVEAYQALRGVQLINAVTLVAEVGDLSRFKHPRQLMCYLGLIPSEHSSGERRRMGGITKAGNRHARCALIEAAWAYRHPARISRPLRVRLEKLPREIQAISWKAQQRLCTQYRKHTARRKKSVVANTAVARELSGFLWAICRVAIEQVPDAGEDLLRTTPKGVRSVKIPKVT